MYDMLIIGGGPSGSAAGRKAALKGLKTVVIEKERFPRYKPCAGGLTVRAITSLDFEIPEKLKEKKICGVRLCAHGGTVESRRDSPAVVTVTRSVFDEYLLEKALNAGSEVKTKERVLQVIERENNVEVITEKGSYRALFAVIAEGAQGLLKRQVVKSGKSGRCALSLVTEIKAEDGQIDRRLPGMLEIHLDVGCRGYGWIFPHNGYYSAGIWGGAEGFSDARRTMTAFLKKAGFESAGRIRGHVIPLEEAKRVSGNSRVLLSGDAAGCVDPFLAEGIAYAIRSGQLAADCIADALQKGEKCSLSAYRKSCRGAFAADLDYARMMAKTVYRSSCFFYRLIAADRSIADHFFRIPAMEGEYLDFLLWFAPRLPKALFLYLLENREMQYALS